MIPQIVAFDLGKVLVDFDYRIGARKISALGRLTPEQVQAALDHSPLLYRFETGLMTNDQFFEEACRITGFRGTFAEFRSCFADIFTPIPAMIELQATLRQRGVPTFIFSNTNELAVTHIRNAFPFFAHFDGYIYSYQVGAMKPAPAIYEALERLAGWRGAEILYLDDRLDNVEGGRARLAMHPPPHAGSKSRRDPADGLDLSR